MIEMRNEIVKLAKNAPINGHVTSDNYEVMKIKSKYNVSDYYMVEVLEDMTKKGELEDVDVKYDTRTGRILAYKFR